VSSRKGLLALAMAALTFLSACGSGDAPPLPVEVDGGAPAEQQIGERLFVDTRFAEYFAAHMTGVNDPLTVGDPVVQTVQNVLTGPQPGPFAGQSINCRSCHFVVEFQGVPGAGNRTYADFTTRSPLPLAMNGFTTTPRKPSAPYDKELPGLNHVAFGVHEPAHLRQIEDHLNSAAVKHSGIGIDSHGKKEYIWFDDPNGFRLEFYCRPTSD